MRIYINFFIVNEPPLRNYLSVICKYNWRVAKKLGRRKKFEQGFRSCATRVAVVEFPKGDILITDGPFVRGTRSTIHLLLAVAPLPPSPPPNASAICLSSLYIKSIPPRPLLPFTDSKASLPRPKSETTGDRDWPDFNKASSEVAEKMATEIHTGLVLYATLDSTIENITTLIHTETLFLSNSLAITLHS